MSMLLECIWAFVVVFATVVVIFGVFGNPKHG